MLLHVISIGKIMQTETINVINLLNQILKDKGIEQAKDKAKHIVFNYHRIRTNANHAISPDTCMEVITATNKWVKEH